MPDFPFQFWYPLTRLGGVGLTLPLALATALWLIPGYGWRIACRWLVLLGVAISVVALTKIAFLGWGIGVRAWDFTGISGHAMLSSAVFPVACSLVLVNMRPLLRLGGVLAGLAIGVAVSVSRVVLDAHSSAEAVVGCLFGALTAGVFIGSIWHIRPLKLNVRVIGFSLVVLTVALHDVRLPTHRWVTQIALDLSGHERPFVRARWKTQRPHPAAPAVPPALKPNPLVTSPPSSGLSALPHL
ncbi:phosphoesterase [Paraburkholderia hayleyella]|uniref:phosphoesterase n=1 Tax=Paraburkholderia hayleyella TaxID=2152889 RepID=UPI001292433F|nr:phosphoesterase [Paraburkholderia hayleyella]